ncbi:hypothetical protein BGZ96_010357 [Linnemannia gamsii]|uniref:Uncharacterized protein n=1 Tax=Linnemannia gamsii TaxID=64522 RepID=A0ABQ7JUJ6_9FUNG|nr:hypothetical protein BGZ96_010357 [Linnemannia gamsii]
MPAILARDPEEDIRIIIATASTCHLFDFETYKRGKLHKQFPHMISYDAYRPGVDNVSIAMPGTPSMTIHGTAAIPIVIDNVEYSVPDVYLVDLGPKVQGIFSFKF